MPEIIEQERIPAPPVADKTALATPFELKKLGEVVTWDIMRLTPNPLNPRGSVDPADASIIELAESVKAHGLIQPILATPTGTIVAGHRRYFACLTAGIQLVRVLVRELSEREQLELMLVENLQRANLNPVQVARGYKALHDRGLSIAAIAEKVGWGKASVSKHLDILSLPEEVQGMYARGELALGYIPHLLEAKDPATQIELATEAAQKGWLINEMSVAVNRRKRPRAPVVEDSKAEPVYEPFRVTLPPYLGKFVELIAAKEKKTPWEYVFWALDHQLEFEADECATDYETLSKEDFLAILEAGGAKGDILQRLKRVQGASV